MSSIQKEACLGKAETNRAADEILSLLGKLVSWSSGLTEDFESRLSHVCNESRPVDEKREKEGTRTFPPYFAEIREKLFVIQTNFSRLQDLLNRCEL